MPLTKYVSVTFTGGSNDGSTSNPYTTIEAARSDIQSNATDNGPHYIILSESSAATTVYKASYGMPSGFEQEFWMGSYHRGVIVSGAHGQDIIIDGEGVTNKSAFEFYGSGSGAHNLTIRNIGSNSNPNYGALRFTKRPADVRGVTISGSICGGITMLGDYSHVSPNYYNAWTIIDSCRIHMGSPAASRRGISWSGGTTSRHGLVNNCLIVYAGSSTITPTQAIWATEGDTYTTASFCTVAISVKDALHTDSGLGITAGHVTNCIVSMSLAHNDNDDVCFIRANTATNNLYAGYNDGSATGVGADGVRQTLNGTSASFDSTAIRYHRNVSSSLFREPDTTFNSLFADWSLASDSPALNEGVAIDYFGLTTSDMSGTVRADPPDLGAFEFVSAAVAGYANTVKGVVAGSLGKVLGVAKANISKIIGT